MLEYISIKNAALIEEAEINFKDGLNILSGETGSGKSMVIDSVNFVLGERTGKDFIRKDTQSAKVEALFSMREGFDKSLFSDNGIEIGEDNSILITRVLNKNGKTISRINGTTVTLAMVKKLSESLIDIHGQHEHQSLLNSAKHIGLLDKFCGDALEEKKKYLSELFAEYRANAKKYSGLITNKAERERREKTLEAEINEIKTADIKENEEETLEKRQAMLLNSEKIMELSDNCAGLLYEGTGNSPSAYDNLSKFILFMAELSDIDESVSDILESAETAYAIIEDMSRNLKRYIDKVDMDPNELEKIDKRLNKIYELKRKYGRNLDEIGKYLSNAEAEYDSIINSDETLKALNKEKEAIIKKITYTCGEITEIRIGKAALIEETVEKHLRDMEMKEARFKISIEPKKAFSLNGRDNVEFLISANKGEELKPLAKIASGGEMSRVMLALKTVLSDGDGIETFIFDEIDTGVSGRTAQKVAEKMSLIGKNHQILCITHLPQIAAMGDSNFKIEKTADNERTVTSVRFLSSNESVEEIARLIGGVELTEATFKAAEEMKGLAEQRKTIIRSQ